MQSPGCGLCRTSLCPRAWAAAASSTVSHAQEASCPAPSSAPAVCPPPPPPLPTAAGAGTVGGAGTADGLPVARTRRASFTRRTLQLFWVSLLSGCGGALLPSAKPPPERQAHLGRAHGPRAGRDATPPATLDHRAPRGRRGTGAGRAHAAPGLVDARDLVGGRTLPDVPAHRVRPARARVPAPHVRHLAPSAGRAGRPGRDRGRLDDGRPSRRRRHRAGAPVAPAPQGRLQSRADGGRGVHGGAGAVLVAGPGPRRPALLALPGA